MDIEINLYLLGHFLYSGFTFCFRCQTAVICLMRLDCHPVFSQVESLIEIPIEISQEAFEEDYLDLSKLKSQMEILIKELVFMAVVVLG